MSHKLPPILPPSDRSTMGLRAFWSLLETVVGLLEVGLIHLMAVVMCFIQLRIFIVPSDKVDRSSDNDLKRRHTNAVTV